jgi:urease accessory protein
MSSITTEAAQLRLLQLGSACLPVGAYAFSQGLEAATELRWVRAPAELESWLSTQLLQGLGCVDLPLLLRLADAWCAQDLTAVQYWNALLLACRESHELRLGDTATGAALARLLPELGVAVPAEVADPAFATLFALAAVTWQVPAPLAALGYAWSWLENQLIAATKLLPLGQTRAQLLLSALQQQIPAALAHARMLDDADIGASLPGLALCSIHHETQYTRLFRS